MTPRSASAILQAIIDVCDSGNRADLVCVQLRRLLDEYEHAVVLEQLETSLALVGKEQS